ncbi:uncharacterized protein [Spinacia oleracea]|uniref:Transmembrane protein n=1 Tax=Spinacia oleracea TaxID=3562 RepID=A0ABM3QYH5_SPIOL|nr:uncharacterized protein LOC130463357 [Spinacia oleracea]
MQKDRSKEGREIDERELKFEIVHFILTIVVAIVGEDREVSRLEGSGLSCKTTLYRVCVRGSSPVHFIRGSKYSDPIKSLFTLLFPHFNFQNTLFTFRREKVLHLLRRFFFFHLRLHFCSRFPTILLFFLQFSTQRLCFFFVSSVLCYGAKFRGTLNSGYATAGGSSNVELMEELDRLVAFWWLRHRSPARFVWACDARLAPLGVLCWLSFRWLLELTRL